MAEDKIFYPDKVDGKKIENTIGEEVNAGIDTQKKRLMSDWQFGPAGSLAFVDSTGSPTVKINSDGMQITGGKISIKDGDENSVVDASGIVSTTQFTAASVQGSGDQTTDDTSYVDVSGLTTTFTLARTQNVLMFAQYLAIQEDGGSFTQYPKVKLLVDSTIVGVETYGGWLQATTQEIVSLTAGSHTLKLRFKRSGGDSGDEVTIYRANSIIGYVTLGK